MKIFIVGKKITGSIQSNKRKLKFEAGWGGLLDLGWPIQYNLNDAFIERMQKSLDKGIGKFCIDMGSSEEVSLEDMMGIAKKAKELMG